ncbi:hypothetical protein CBS470a_012994 [Colletotrichum nupharicola]|nr:hypothetical protein CBS470a_012994 [Colletotrichum nupharicola]
MTSIRTINDEKTVSEVVETSFEPIEITYTSTSAFTVPPRTSDVTSVIVSAVPSTVASVVTSTSPPQVYVSVGTTEITKFITVPGGNRGNEPQTQPPVFQVITSVYGGKVETFVDKGTPQTMVKSDGGVYTVAFTPPPQTIVTHEGGQATQMVITVTPSPEVAFVAVPTTKDDHHRWHTDRSMDQFCTNSRIQSHFIDPGVGDWRHYRCIHDNRSSRDYQDDDRRQGDYHNKDAGTANVYIGVGRDSDDHDHHHYPDRHNASVFYSNHDHWRHLKYYHIHSRIYYVHHLYLGHIEDHYLHTKSHNSLVNHQALHHSYHLHDQANINRQP